MPCARSSAASVHGVEPAGHGEPEQPQIVAAAKKKLPLWAAVTHAAHATLFDFSNSTRCVPEGGCATLLRCDLRRDQLT